MELFFSPLACSLAVRSVLYEAGADADLVQVDTKAQRTSTGADYRAINPLGLVPALRTAEGEVLTENLAILLYLADAFPEAQLAPRDGIGRVRLQQWLCFVATELHKPLFTPLLDASSPEGAKEYARAKGSAKLDHLQQHLQDREFLLERFSVADAYLGAVLNWASVTSIKLGEWPVVAAYHKRVHARPSFARAFSEELSLYSQRN